ncbi:SDR family oxidoreductase [Altererythrobacter sp.]|uniref:SDR family oxidoreductase n=1 Tax=Altererythrobacter sp. TaxID=1872480 RepID=UPI003D0C5E0F
MSKPSVLVTGGAHRIGAEIARQFGEAGWHVIIHYGKSQEDADQLAASLPSAETIQCDLADGDAAVAMVKELAARLDDWRVLINCAAIFWSDHVTALDPETNRAAMQINAVTPARMAQTFLADARARQGRCVIQFTDQKLENPNPDFFSYTMSKHAAAATIPMLAEGAAGADDRVYGLAPGAILPSHDQTEDEAEVSHRLNLLERKTGIEEVAHAALFLAQGTLRSGETLFVDSGQHMLDQPRDVIYLAREIMAQS